MQTDDLAVQMVQEMRAAIGVKHRLPVYRMNRVEAIARRYMKLAVLEVEMENEAAKMYCSTCGSCGEDGCGCLVRCQYKDERIKSLESRIAELEAIRAERAGKEPHHER